MRLLDRDGARIRAPGFPRAAVSPENVAGADAWVVASGGEEENLSCVSSAEGRWWFQVLFHIVKNGYYRRGAVVSIGRCEQPSGGDTVVRISGSSYVKFYLVCQH